MNHKNEIIRNIHVRNMLPHVIQDARTTIYLSVDNPYEYINTESKSGLFYNYELGDWQPGPITVGIMLSSPVSILLFLVVLVASFFNII